MIKKLDDTTEWTQERYEALIEGVDAIVWEADADTFRFTYVSKRAEAMLGYPLARWFEPDFWKNIIHEEDREWAVEFCAAAAERGEDHDFEYRVVAADGRVVWLRDSVRIHIDLALGQRLLRGVMVDVTEQQRHEAMLIASSQALLDREQALAESVERFRRAFEDSGVGMALVDLEGRFLQVNKQMCAITGRDPDQLIGTSFEEVTHPEDRAAGRASAGRLVAGEWETARREKRYLKPDGSVVWGQVTTSLIRAADGKPAYFVSQIQDISEQRKQHARFRALVQHSSDVILVIDAAGTIAYVSPAIEKLLGYRAEELFGRSGFDFIHSEDDPAAREELARALQNKGETVTHERVVIHKDGSDVHIEVSLTNLLDDPSVNGIVANVRDITERKLTEMALRAANAVQAELAAILFSSADAIIGSTLGGVVSSWNEAAERLFGYEREEIIGKRIGRLIPDHPAYDTDRIIELVKDGKAEFDSRGLRKDGTYVEIAVTLSPIRAPDDEITGISGSIRDVGEQRALEVQLRQAQKMEAIARLAGGVSHDFNNLLTAILGNCEMLLDEPSLPTPVREQVSEIREAAEIGEAISGQLLDISRHRVVREETIYFHEIVAQMESLLRRLIGEDVELIIEMAGDDVPVVGDAGQLEQVILNLTVNARDAMPEGGSLTLALDTVDISPADPFQRSGLEPGRYAVLTATDVGAGMPEEVKERIFEPFFTTKEGSLATGLGLSTVYQIVSQMGGSVTVDSTPGVGSSFKVFLRVGRKEAADKIEVEPIQRDGRRASVLLVEDDDRVRPVLQRTLEAGGYRVIEAVDAAEARVKAEAEGFSIDLLVTDIVMPGTRGTALAEELRELIPDLRVVLISGHGGETVRTGPDGEGDVFLEKPFRPRELLAVATQVLDGSTPDQPAALTSSRLRTWFTKR